MDRKKYVGHARSEAAYSSASKELLSSPKQKREDFSRREADMKRRRSETDGISKYKSRKKHSREDRAGEHLDEYSYSNDERNDHDGHKCRNRKATTKHRIIRNDTVDSSDRNYDDEPYESSSSDSESVRKEQRRRKKDERKKHRKRKDKKRRRDYYSSSELDSDDSTYYKKRKHRKDKKTKKKKKVAKLEERRSVISGKRIKMHIEKTEEDLARDEARKNYLEFMNSSVR